MTTKQDYIGSILQGLAGITLSSPHHEFLAEIDRVIAEFHRQIDPKGCNTPYDSKEAIEILMAFNDLEDDEDFSIDEKNRGA